MFLACVAGPTARRALPGCMEIHIWIPALEPSKRIATHAEAKVGGSKLAKSSVVAAIANASGRCKTPRCACAYAVESTPASTASAMDVLGSPA